MEGPERQGGENRSGKVAWLAGLAGLGGSASGDCFVLESFSREALVRGGGSCCCCILDGDGAAPAAPAAFVLIGFVFPSLSLSASAVVTGGLPLLNLSFVCCLSLFSLFSLFHLFWAVFRSSIMDSSKYLSGRREEP